MAGVDSTGFTPKTYDETLVSLDASAKTNIDSAMVSPIKRPTSKWGQIANLFAYGLAEVWQAAADAAHMMDPRNAEGDWIDGIGFLRGNARKGAAKTTFIAKLNVSAPAQLTAGSVMIRPTGSIAPAYTNKYGMTIGADSGVVFECQNSGAFVVPNGAAMDVVTTGGWTITVATLVSNTQITGHDAETDSVYMTRQNAEIGKANSNILPALARELSNVKGVTYFDFTTYVGRIDTIVAGTASDEDIANAIYKHVSPGTFLGGSHGYPMFEPVALVSGTTQYPIRTDVRWTPAATAKCWISNLTILLRRTATAPEKTAYEQYVTQRWIDYLKTVKPGGTIRGNNVIKFALEYGGSDIVLDCTVIAVNGVSFNADLSYGTVPVYDALIHANIFNYTGP